MLWWIYTPVRTALQGTFFRLGRDRSFTGSTYTEPRALLALSAPGLLGGFRLATPPVNGGLRSSVDQMILVMPLGLLGLATFSVAFLVGQWILPPSFEEWVSLMQDLLPLFGSLSEDFGVPTILVSSFVAFATYSLIGRWRIKTRYRVLAEALISQHRRPLNPADGA
jgi:hypothetical protein